MTLRGTAGSESGHSAAGIGIASGSLIGMLVGVVGGPIRCCSGGVSPPRPAPVRRGTPGHGDEAIAASAPDTAWWQRRPGRDRRSHDRAVGAVRRWIRWQGIPQAAGRGVGRVEAQDEAAREADKAPRKAIREQKKQERKETSRREWPR